MSWYWRILLALFALHVLCMSLYVHRVPGLLGDEGSEGENVYHILDTRQLTIYGERSYIGPLIDYVRIPFVLAFGYTALSLRLVILLFSFLTFWLAAAVFKEIFGETASLYILAAIFFSPIYLLYQRLGWAITLIPFFAVLIIWLLQRENPWKYLWAGLAAGIGLHNHFIFLPTLVGVTFTSIVYHLLSRLPAVARSAKAGPPAFLFFIKTCFIFFVGFLAGFSTQLAVLLTQSDDQGNPTKVIQLFTERVAQLPEALPAFLSGSVFSAFYTGDVFATLVVTGVALALGVLTALALFFSTKKLVVALSLIGAAIQLFVLIVIVDRFAARYFVMTALSVWGFAGLGLFIALKKLRLREARLTVAPLILAVALTGTLSAPALFHFLANGGSTADVQISAERREPAAAFVDIRPLIACVSDRGPIYSENVHIYNRLLYLSHAHVEIEVTEHAEQAHVVVAYRTSDTKPRGKELCPRLKHFQVLETAT